MKTLQDVLENIKSSGAYQVMCYYGEEVGCDDMDVPANNRNVRIIWHPVGCLWEVRCMWYGKLIDALDIEYKSLRPEKVSNPPKENEVSGFGFWAWGAGNIDNYMGRFDK